MTEQKQLKDLSIIELKAVVYDLNTEMVNNERAIKLINQELDNRYKQEAEKPKEETKLEAKEEVKE